MPSNPRDRRPFPAPPGGVPIVNLKPPIESRPRRWRDRRSFWLLLSLAWAGLIFGFSTAAFSDLHTARILHGLLRALHLELAPERFAADHFLIRKLGHFTEYAIFAVLLHGWFHRLRRSDRTLTTSLGVVLVAGLYSLTDEFHQSFIPDRSASLQDCAIDTLGAAAGLSVDALVRSLRARARRGKSGSGPQ